MLIAACAACAGASRADLTPLREEVAALRQAHEADRKRIEALELQASLQQAELIRVRGGAVSDRAEGLPVVRLQPHAMRDLPSLSTATPVREPPPDKLAELQQGPPIELAEASPGREEADALFSGAFGKLKTGELVGAAAMFHSFAQRFPHHPAADNAMLDEGIADYGLRRFQDALDVFGQLSRRYPAGDAVPEALWRSADCYLKLDEMAKAQETYEAIVKRFPGSPEAAKATAKLAGLDTGSSHVASTEGGSK